MDACYGGLALTRALEPGSSRFLTDMLLRYSRQILTAGKADEVVADSGGPLSGHSVFTGHLIEALNGKAATPEGVLTASGVMAYVYEKVATDRDSHQTPHYGHFDGDGDFVLQAPGLEELAEEEEVGLDELIAVPYPESEVSVATTDEKLRTVKRLLADEASSIELHDLVVREVQQFLASTSEDYFHMDGEFSNEELLERITRYEEVSADLAGIATCIGHWGKQSHQQTLRKILGRSADRLRASRRGKEVWLALRWYPLIRLFYSASIAAIAGRRYETLTGIFSTPAGDPLTGGERERRGHPS